MSSKYSTPSPRLPTMVVMKRTYLNHVAGPGVGAVDEDVVPREAADALDALLVVDGDLVPDNVTDTDAVAAAVQVGDPGAHAVNLPIGQHRRPRDVAPREPVGGDEVDGSEVAGGVKEGPEGAAFVFAAESGPEPG